MRVIVYNAKRVVLPIMKFDLAEKIEAA